MAFHHKFCVKQTRLFINEASKNLHQLLSDPNRSLDSMIATAHADVKKVTIFQSVFAFGRFKSRCLVAFFCHCSHQMSSIMHKTLRTLQVHSQILLTHYVLNLVWKFAFKLHFEGRIERHQLQWIVSRGCTIIANYTILFLVDVSGMKYLNIHGTLKQFINEV